MKKRLHLLFACAAFALCLSAQTTTSLNPVSAANSDDRAQYDISDKSMIRFNTDITTAAQPGKPGSPGLPEHRESQLRL